MPLTNNDFVKVTSQEATLLRLMQSASPDTEGWINVGPVVWSAVSKLKGSDYFELTPQDGGGKVRLTERGQLISDLMMA